MRKGEKKKSGLTKNWLEWTVFGVGLALIICVAAYLVYDGMRAEESAPLIEIRLGEPEQRGAEYVVPVVVSNRGNLTAEGVQVEVTLEGAGGAGGAGGAETERGEFTIAFLPRRATRSGWVAFRTDPRGRNLKPRILGYEKP